MTAITGSAVTTAGLLLLDDRALVGRILDHVDHGTTDLAGETWREPVDSYRSPARLEAEMALVMRRAPTPFCPSAALPEAGSFIARNAAGVPLVVVRDREGVARAFRNVCRHRGMALCAGTGRVPSLVCPYHGWAYRLDGELRHVPGEHGFPDLDKSTRGLVAVRAEERAGLVFVTQDEPAVPGSSIEGLPELIGSELALNGVHELMLEVNWKLFVETFLEGYHIKSTHPETFYPFGYDNLNVVETFGARHSRVTFPFRRIERQRDIPESQRSSDGSVVSVYHLFPNAVVSRFTHHTQLLVVDPVSVDRSRLITYAMSNRGPASNARAAADRDQDFLNRGATEDRAMASAVQQGLASGANETMEFGRFEGAIIRLHRHLHELIGGAPPG